MILLPFDLPPLNAEIIRRAQLAIPRSTRCATASA
jgi:hypothetical protein